MALAEGAGVAGGEVIPEVEFGVLRKQVAVRRGLQRPSKARCGGRRRQRDEKREVGEGEREYYDGEDERERERGESEGCTEVSMEGKARKVSIARTLNSMEIHQGKRGGGVVC